MYPLTKTFKLSRPVLALLLSLFMALSMWSIAFADEPVQDPLTTDKVHVTEVDGEVTAVSIDVPLVNQMPTYPTGCEAASMAMLLQFYGYDVTLDQMIEAIPRENLETVNGRRYGPRITEKFVGDPRGGYTSANPGYGAFSPVVTKSINDVLLQRHMMPRAINKTGASLDELLGFLKEGRPVIVWSTYNMKTPETENEWYIRTDNGDEHFSYPRGTHVCVLIGFDENNITLADPYGATKKTFSKSSFEAKYRLLGQQAVLLQ